MKKNTADIEVTFVVEAGNVVELHLRSLNGASITGTELRTVRVAELVHQAALGDIRQTFRLDIGLIEELITRGKRGRTTVHEAAWPIVNLIALACSEQGVSVHKFLMETFDLTRGQANYWVVLARNSVGEDVRKSSGESNSQ